MHVIVQNAMFIFLPLGVAISKECNLIFFRLKGLYMTDKVCRYMDLYTRGDVMKIGILFRTVKLLNCLTDKLLKFISLVFLDQESDD